MPVLLDIYITYLLNIIASQSCILIKATQWSSQALTNSVLYSL